MKEKQQRRNALGTQYTQNSLAYKRLYRLELDRFCFTTTVFIVTENRPRLFVDHSIACRRLVDVYKFRVHVHQVKR